MRETPQFKHRWGNANCVESFSCKTLWLDFGEEVVCQWPFFFYKIVPLMLCKVLFGKKCNGAGWKVRNFKVSTIILIVGQWHDWTINKYQGIPGVRHRGKRWRLDTSLKPACTCLVEQWHVAESVGVIRESGGSGYSATWWLNSKESGGNLVALRLLSLSADRCTGKINNKTKKRCWHSWIHHLLGLQ